jgi:rare lipoprotein A
LALFVLLLAGPLAGFATFYDDSLHGDLMANSQPYNMWDPTTAASNLYPLGTRLKVTRVVTGRSIVVRVTDRGGMEPPLLVDLSYAAFVSLADPEDGRIRVIVEALD